MKNSDRKEENHKVIIKTAEKLFCSMGVEKMTLQLIAEKTSISYRSILRHYESKEKLVMCIMYDIVNDFKQAINKLIVASEFKVLDGRTQLHKFLQLLFSIAVDKGQYFVGIEELDVAMKRSNHYELLELHKKGIECVKKVLTQVIEKGIKDGTIHDQELVNDSNSLVLLISIQGFFYEISKFTCNIKTEDKTDIKMLADQYIQMLEKTY